jgi:single-stranded DNA-binding protein
MEWEQAIIEGRLKSRTYQTQGGETRFSNDVMVSEFQFLGKRDGQASQDDDSATDDADGLPWQSTSSPKVGNQGIPFSLCSPNSFRGQEMAFQEVSGGRGD